jgi:stage II sporulation protein D
MRRRQRPAAPLVLALSALALGACTVAGPGPHDPAPRAPAPDAPPAEITAEPEVRVGVKVDVASLQLDGTTPIEIVDEAGRVRTTGRGPWTVRATDAGIELSGGGETLRSPGILIARPGRAASGQVRIDGKSYRGAVLLRPAASGVTAANLIDLEAYLLGVVPHEIGAGRPPEELEAVKAQAIAARTYAIRHMGRRDALGFDFYATVQDQVYGGMDAEDPVSSQAVRETAGEIIAYDGTPIEAFYHSTCGGHTAALEEVWTGSPRPYLRSVSDRRPDGGWYCETSNRFRWTEEWDRSELHSTLTANLAESGAARPVTRVESMAITERTPSGRAATLRVRTNLGESRVPGDSIRRVLQPEPNRILNSTAIEVHTHGSGEVTRLVVEGAGWGHGIGMCQIGALGRARGGHSYREILTTYYPGTRILRLY